MSPVQGSDIPMDTLVTAATEVKNSCDCYWTTGKAEDVKQDGSGNRNGNDTILSGLFLRSL